MNTDFLEYINVDRIIKIKSITKHEALDEMISYACTQCAVPEGIMKDAVWERENKISTGVGHGLAIPHIRLTNFGDPIALLGVSEDGINDYESIDGDPVEVIVLLVADGNDTNLYLDLLKSISSRLRTHEAVVSVKSGIVNPATLLEKLKASE